MELREQNRTGENYAESKEETRRRVNDEGKTSKEKEPLLRSKRLGNQ